MSPDGRQYADSAATQQLCCSYGCAACTWYSTCQLMTYVVYQVHLVEPRSVNVKKTTTTTTTADNPDVEGKNTWYLSIVVYYVLVILHDDVHLEVNETITTEEVGWCVCTVTAAGRQQADCHQISLSADTWYLVPGIPGSCTQHTYVVLYCTPQSLNDSSQQHTQNKEREY